MKMTKTAAIALMNLACITAMADADDRVTVCESGETGARAKLEFRFQGPGRYEALKMEYQGRNVLKEPRSIFNHMGLILFRGDNRIEFTAYEYSDEFQVTIPLFGDGVKTAHGKCRLKE